MKRDIPLKVVPDRAPGQRTDDMPSSGPGRSNTLLILGGATIIGSVGYTLGHLDDRTVLTVLVPGIVLGLVCVGFSIATRKGSRDE